MLFQTTQAHEELRSKIRAFAEEEIKPIAFMLDQNNEFPTEAVKKLGELGWMGIPFPVEYGGMGGDALSYAIAVEELARVDGGAGVILSAHTSLGTWPIYAFGNEEQKKKYLVPLAKGEKIGAFGLTEPNAGSDSGGTETTAVDKGDHYLLNGGKIFITNAPKADTYVVFAVTTPDIGTRGISAFIVEKGWPGFEYGDHYDKLGIRSSTTAELIFNDVKVPKENLLGKEGDGFKIAMATLDGGRIGIGAQALGIAQGAYEEALAYAKERQQFGKPIGVNQGVSFKLADMATKLRCARFLVYSAAELKEEHAPYAMEAAMAKMYASDIALEVCNDALQIFGGTGFLKGMHVERAYRDAKITTIYEGTNEIQRVVIASHLLGKLTKGNEGGGRSTAKKPAPITGIRKKQIFREGDTAQKVADLVAALKKDGYDFSVGIPMDTPISQAERVVSVGKGVGDKANMTLIEDLAKAAGAAIGSSRPVAETLQYLPLNRYVGMSGQKFLGNLYIACGISGASQHLKGIKDASTIVAINKNGNAPIFKNCDYGIVGDMMEIIPLLIEALGGTAEKEPAPPMVKMKRPKPPKPTPIGKSYVCSGCGYLYNPDLGDEEGEIPPGTLFEHLPEDWVCPECSEGMDQFIEG
ncbi:MAG: acyl-CoA dehydrogenase family protein [Ruminiclostridium sp.]|nr:acyl-CoA dehydrogenase family protein [Ruminiclostridium sp.]